jgi:membrane protease YdiL (CAAX protease family)
MNSSEATNQLKPEARGLKARMSKRPLFYYVLLTYVFSWLMVLPAILFQWGFIRGDYTFGLMAKQWIGPALAAIIMTRIVDGKAGSKILRDRCLQWKAGWKWYLFILVGIPLLILLAVILLPGVFAGFKGVPSNLLSSYLYYFIAIFIGVGLPEEIGWRGFALPRMQPRYGPLWGAVLLGIIWAFWHLPFFLLPDHGGGPGTPWSTFLLNFGLFFLWIVSLSIVFSWVFNHTRGSVFIASLLHTSIDAPQLVWLPLFLAVGVSNTASGETWSTVAMLAVFGVLAILILIFTRGKLGYQPEK